jgi:hypothetical protein
MKTERNTPTQDKKKDEPYQLPRHSMPHGRFIPLGEGCYRAAVLSNGEGGRQ